MISSKAIKSSVSESLPVIAIVLAWLGLVISSLILLSNPETLCRAGAGCASVLHSRFASVGGVSLAWFGAAFYALLTAGFLGVKTLNDGPGRRRIVQFIQILSLIGALVSACLMFIQFVVLRAFCPLCTCSAGLAVLLCLLSTAEFTPRPPGVSQYESFGFLLILSVSLAAIILTKWNDADSRVVLAIDGRKVTERELTNHVNPVIGSHEFSIYWAKLAWIENEVADVVLGEEARRRGLSVDRLIESELLSRVGVSEEEIAEWLKQGERTPTDEARSAARAEIFARKKGEAFGKYLESLKSGHRIRVRLQKPAPRLNSSSLALARTAGPVDAPVQLIVFSDFQCSFCATLASTLHRAREAFPREVVLGFRHFPVEGHPRARPAAEAAECAFAQGKFWQFHDELFARGGGLAEEDLRKAAKAVGLDEGQFEECLRSGAGSAAVEASYRDGVSAGIEGSPSLFLNGRMIGNSIKYEDLAALIRDELAKKKP